MKIFIKIVGLSLTINSASAQNEGDWINLLKGENLEQWQNGSKHNRLKIKEVGEQWSVKDDVLSLDKSKEGRGGHIITKKQDFFNFEFKFEFKISEKGNSGVKYRVSLETVGLEYQVLDDSDNKVAKNSLASLYNLKAAADTKKVNTSGVEWNTGRIIAEGDKLEHWLNGEKVMSIKFGSKEWKETFAKSKYKEISDFAAIAGPIHLQDHGDDVQYRNLFIRELKVKPQKKVKKEAVEAPAVFTQNCAACHISDKVIVGPHFVHIQEFYPRAKREQFIEWCINPGKRNPDMVQMPSMAHVAKEDLIKIHDYILSVDVKNPKGASNKDSFPDTRRPRIVRTFLPDCGPAPVLVALPTEKKLNLIWDTTLCRLRYLTLGEVDNFPYLRSNGNSLADPGKKVYVENALFGGSDSVKFNGYKLINKLPVFLYEVSGVKIEEAISLEGETIVRTITSDQILPTLIRVEEVDAKIKTTVEQSEKKLIIKHSL